MNALIQPPKLQSDAPLEVQLQTMTPSWLDAVVQIEQSAYPHPWSRGNFADSLQAGYHGQLLTAGQSDQSTLLGYFVAMLGVAEVHLLNITVAPAYQRQGWGRVMLDALCLWSRGQQARCLWLEVRLSNTGAQSLYSAYGFRKVGIRRHYYPAAGAEREDAQVMTLAL